MNETETILIIEDEPEISELLAIFFETFNYKVAVCSTFKESQEVIEKITPWAIFCDFLLPDAKGDFIYNALKKKDVSLIRRFVLMTGTLIEGEIMDFVESEKITVLHKPFSIEILNGIIASLKVK